MPAYPVHSHPPWGEPRDGSAKDRGVCCSAPLRLALLRFPAGLVESSSDLSLIIGREQRFAVVRHLLFQLFQLIPQFRQAAVPVQHNVVQVPDGTFQVGEQCFQLINALIKFSSLGRGVAGKG